jgi:hypothetical protein
MKNAMRISLALLMTLTVGALFPPAHAVTPFYSLLFYDAGDGSGADGHIDDGGFTTDHSYGPGSFTTGWTHVSSAGYTARGFIKLFYDAGSGSAADGQVDAYGGGFTTDHTYAPAVSPQVGPTSRAMSGATYSSIILKTGRPPTVISTIKASTRSTSTFLAVSAPAGLTLPAMVTRATSSSTMPETGRGLTDASATDSSPKTIIRLAVSALAGPSSAAMATATCFFMVPETGRGPMGTSTLATASSPTTRIPQALSAPAGRTSLAMMSRVTYSFTTPLKAQGPTGISTDLEAG